MRDGAVASLARNCVTRTGVSFPSESSAAANAQYRRPACSGRAWPSESAPPAPRASSTLTPSENGAGGLAPAAAAASTSANVGRGTSPQASAWKSSPVNAPSPPAPPKPPLLAGVSCSPATPAVISEPPDSAPPEIPAGALPTSSDRTYRLAPRSASASNSTSAARTPPAGIAQLSSNRSGDGPEAPPSPACAYSLEPPPSSCA